MWGDHCGGADGRVRGRVYHHVPEDVFDAVAVLFFMAVAA